MFQKNGLVNGSFSARIRIIEKNAVNKIKHDAHSIL